MKKIVGISVLIFTLFFLLLWSCKPLQTYPIIPEISFKSLTILEEVESSNKDLILLFHLIDGDGDVGLPSDTISYPDPNLYVTFLQKTDTGFTEIPTEFPWTFRTPYVDIQGQDKSLVADFEVTMNIIKYLPENKIIKLSYYIFDRQMHKSNVAETPEFKSDTLGVITIPGE